jgi:putative transposase
MPRMARLKALDSIFHIMCRSISEVDLCKTKDDKLKYIYYIKKYQKLYEFKVYGYCLMDNHIHLLIDANGADISQIMYSINFAYAQYYNRFHKRHGHLFQDRFKSKIITDDRYLLTASAYIHNNPVDVPEYKDSPEKYDFSSLAVYLGIKSDPYNLVSSRFVLSLFGKTPKAARERYMKFVCKCDDLEFKESVEFENDTTEYRSERRILVRNRRIEDAMDYIANSMNIPKLKLHAKNCRKVVEAKALLVLLMRHFCNYKCSDICKNLGNITQSRVSMLSSLGVELIEKNEKYRRIIEDFIKPHLIQVS